jgi:hypothetical protein
VPWEPWQYRESSPSATDILVGRVVEEQRRVLAGGYDVVGRTKDTRRTHKFFFNGLTPMLFPCFAGNYRGSPIKGLVGYPVTVPSDPRVGIPASSVAQAMTNLAITIVDGISALDISVPNAQPGHGLLLCVEVVCEIFVRFLTIHPYVDGNGHMARYILWTILSRFGFRTDLFTIEPRPLEKNYAPYIALYRGGQRRELAGWVLSCFYAAAPGTTATSA